MSNLNYSLFALLLTTPAWAVLLLGIVSQNLLLFFLGYLNIVADLGLIYLVGYFALRSWKNG